MPLRNRLVVRTLIAVIAASAALTAVFVPTSAGDLQSQIDAGKAAASSLNGAIAAQTAQINQTAGGLASARARLAEIQSTLNTRIGQLRNVQSNLITARDKLMDLENRLHDATQALSANLVQAYEQGQPNLMSVILSARGFSQLLEQLDFLNKIGHQDATIVGSTRAARQAVAAETLRLVGLEQRDHALTDQVLKQRNEAAALQAALLNREISELSTRSGERSKLAGLNSQLSKLEAKAAAQARAEAIAQAKINGAVASGSANGIAVDPGGMVQAPADAPLQVREVIAAGNAIATLPYIWGGGHGSFQSPGYDCSGSVSYALAAAGLLSSPLDSTGFESWGLPGPGKWITVYANADHAWMTVAGWRYDTVALAETGTRWAQGGGEFAGMVERHPPGL
jgi:cell wall-associated NlpC family hydrolase